MSLTPIGLGILTTAMLLAASGLVDTGDAQSETEQSIQGGGVTVTAKLLKHPGDTLTFLISLNTHSVNLDLYRFEEIVRLRDGQGGELAPTALEDVTGGGHHRRATLRFAWPQPRPKALEIVVKGVAGVPERVFRWMVE
ncbi:MAG: hypothetical protein ACE5IQ_04340 [Candidatus Methylomirabilales bacterium]